MLVASADNAQRHEVCGTQFQSLIYVFDFTNFRFNHKFDVARLLVSEVEVDIELRIERCQTDMDEAKARTCGKFIMNATSSRRLRAI